MLAAALLAAIGCSHATVPAKAVPPPLQFLGEWGMRGEGLGQLVSPCCLATDHIGNVFIADVRGSSTLVQKFDHEGHPLLAFYVGGAPRPSSITVDHGGAIYLTQRSPGDLYIFYADGTPFRTIHRISGRALESPEGVATDESGSIYLTQAEGNRVLSINFQGRLLESWGTKGDAPGQFSSPSKIAAAPDGSVFVADIGNRRLEKFQADGKFVAAWNLLFTDPPSAASPSDKNVGLTVSEKFVAISDGGSLEIWTLDGKPSLVQDHLPPVASQEPAAPADIAIAPNGDLLVLDAARARVLRFHLNL